MGFNPTCYDVLIKNGTVWDPSTGVKEKRNVGIYGSRIADVFEPDRPKICGSRVIDAEGKYVIPGLIDAHAHVLPGLPFSYPIDEVWKRGIVSLIDLGSNAAGSFNRLRRQYVDNAPMPVNVALGLSSQTDCRGGITRYTDLEAEVNKEKIKAVFESNPDCLVGIKVLIGHNDSPGRDLTLAVMKKARETCDYVGCRMFVHVANPDAKLPEFIDYFKAGDVFEHTYNKGNILDDNGQVYAEAWEAKKRGVLFSSSRGSRNWSSEVASTTFAQGFVPDIISDDLTCLSNDPYTSRLHVHMGECVAMGMSPDEVLRKVTVEPAKLMKNVEVGLHRGMAANITIMDIAEGEHIFRDAFGLTYPGPLKFTPLATIYRGEIKYNAIETDY